MNFDFRLQSEKTSVQVSAVTKLTMSLKQKYIIRIKITVNVNITSQQSPANSLYTGPIIVLDLPTPFQCYLQAIITPNKKLWRIVLSKTTGV